MKLCITLDLFLELMIFRGFDDIINEILFSVKYI